MGTRFRGTVVTTLLGLSLLANAGLPPAEIRIPEAERRALIAFFHATNGNRWNRKNGWLERAGTECGWYGVECQPVAGPDGPVLTVTGIVLPSNGLKGSIPIELSSLASLQELSIQSNEVERPLPAVLLRRWDAGELQVRPLHLIHSTTRVTLVVDTPAVRCSGYQVVFTHDGHVLKNERICTGAIERCRESNGRTLEFDRLARQLESSYRGAAAPMSKWLDVGFARLQLANTAGSRDTTLSMAPDAPLGDWTILKIVDGVLARAEWDRDISLQPCTPSK